MQQRDVFSDQASIASRALFILHRRKLYEYRNANGVRVSVKMRSPERYESPYLLFSTPAYQTRNAEGVIIPGRDKGKPRTIAVILLFFAEGKS
ncbi:hypothetical protein DFY03_23755 [Escherichia coli]|nr:hypothetical protein [Escherichia coli]EFB1451865.1 hypothetical protein [Escherichia coli]